MRRKLSLEAQISGAHFSFRDNHASLFAELSRLNSLLDGLRHIDVEFGDICILSELLSSADDDELRAEFLRRKADLLREISAFRLKVLMTGEYDNCPAIITIHAGSGGIDAQDWAAMLYRMYTRYCASQNFAVNTLDILSDDEGGIKSVTFLVRSEYVYGSLKSEAGIHRLVRISPFDSAKRRHTSFSSVTVIPEIGDDVDINIAPDDLRFDTYRSSGAGGQHVNLSGEPTVPPVSPISHNGY